MQEVTGITNQNTKPQKQILKYMYLYLFNFHMKIK